MSEYEYIPSTSPGKTWSLYFYKPEGRPGYYAAIEGELEEGPYGASFKTVLGIGGLGDRRLEARIEGACTAKRKAKAREDLIALLRAEGAIEVQP